MIPRLGALPEIFGLLLTAPLAFMDARACGAAKFIAICMFIGTVTMIGLALAGTLQLRVARSPVVAVAAQ
jgi:hypothetical protein